MRQKRNKEKDSERYVTRILRKMVVA